MAEGLQIAQIIADLQTLQNAEPAAATALLSSAKNPTPRPSDQTTTARRPSLNAYASHTRHKSSNAIPRARTYTELSASSSSASSTTSTSQPTQQQQPARFDKLGRRIVVPRHVGGTGTSTPPMLSRSMSSFSRMQGGLGGSQSLGGSRSGSGVATPIEETQDEDLKRARTLLELFEMRARFKAMGDTGLYRAKQRVDNVVEKYANMELEQREKAAKARHLE